MKGGGGQIFLKWSVVPNFLTGIIMNESCRYNCKLMIN